MLEMLYFLNKISKTNNALYRFIQLVIDEKKLKVVFYGPKVIAE